MNAQKLESRPEPEQIRDPIAVAAQIQTHYKRIVALTQKQEKEREIHGKLSDKIMTFLQKGGAQIRHGEDFEKMLARCKDCVQGNDLLAFTTTLKEFREGIEPAKERANEITSAKSELREIVAREGGRRDGEILALHGALLSKIIEALLPFCSDEKEAEATARGMDKPTQLHLRIAVWRRGDVVGNAVALVAELKTALPSV